AKQLGADFEISRPRGFDVRDRFAQPAQISLSRHFDRALTEKHGLRRTPELLLVITARLSLSLKHAQQQQRHVRRRRSIHPLNTLSPHAIVAMFNFLGFRELVEARKRDASRKTRQPPLLLRIVLDADRELFVRLFESLLGAKKLRERLF